MQSGNGNAHSNNNGMKRKSPEEGKDVVERRASPFDRRVIEERDREGSTPKSRASSVVGAEKVVLPLLEYEVYNGVLDVDDSGFVVCRSVSASPFSSFPTRLDKNRKLPLFFLQESGLHVPTMSISTVFDPSTLSTAHTSKVDTALILIRNTYMRRLSRVPGRPIHLTNSIDAFTPSLRFKYISSCVLDSANGVYRASLDTQQGCSQCAPHMGRSIGCEYTKKCDCLEYAAVDVARITSPELLQQYHEALETGASTLGFPKKFPYFAPGTKREKPGCLVPFYLSSRHPIYECNDACACGPHCRNKLVQFGRTVELEIFRTPSGTGWGLRCLSDLHAGQFIDTYRGEIITDAEATRREEATTTSSSSSSKEKASYLYSLDKFALTESIPQSDIYVVDGEFMGGPTIFMNHSCEPNCRQFTVSYNRHDPRVYEIAFFACREIRKGEELTFDYLDRDEEEEEVEAEEPGEGAVRCLCGTERCRKWLWT